MTIEYQKTPPSKTTTAYLSVPASWSEEIHVQALQRVRTDLPDLRIESFMTVFTMSELLADPPIWRELIQNFIAGVDVLIVATENERNRTVAHCEGTSDAGKSRERLHGSATFDDSSYDTIIWFHHTVHSSMSLVCSLPSGSSMGIFETTSKT